MKTGTIILLLVIFTISFAAEGQIAGVRGTIVNKKSGAAIESVNVVEKGSGIGTISNSTGEFRLMLKPGTTELLISSDGFKSETQKFSLKRDTTITVELEPLLNIKNRKKEIVHASIIAPDEKK